MRSGQELFSLDARGDCEVTPALINRPNFPGCPLVPVLPP